MALREQTPDEVLDTLGRVCPYPLVLTKKKLQNMESGKMLKVLCDAPASATDSIPKYCEKKKLECDLLKVEGQEQWDIYIKKA